MRQGTANLPLHGGHAPRWLFERMVTISAEIAGWIVVEQGTAELFRRLSDPVWFQAFGAVMGMDWHSSGVTTTVCGALKQGIAGRSRELGFVVAGGKGRTSRQTPAELTAAGPWLGLDPAPYVQASRMATKVDNNALQMATKSTITKIREMTLPAHHDVKGADVDPKRLRRILLKTYDRQPEDFATLLGMEGVGARTLRALSLVGELVYGAPVSITDPARFSFAHGGKDGHPYPVDKKTYDKSIQTLHTAVEKAKIGQREQVEALRRLTQWSDMGRNSEVDT